MEFEISRIHTHSGIFRLSGQLFSTGCESRVAFKKVEFMGTDGWRNLDLESTSGKEILAKIRSEVISHLTNDRD